MCQDRFVRRLIAAQRAGRGGHRKDAAPKNISNKKVRRKLAVVLVAMELRLWRFAWAQSMAEQNLRGDSAPDQVLAAIIRRTRLDAQLDVTSGVQLTLFATPSGQALQGRHLLLTKETNWLRLQGVTPHHSQNVSRKFICRSEPLFNVGA